MGLDYGYDPDKKKWYAKGLWFLKWYDTEEAMEADKLNAQNEYFRKKKYMKSIAMGFASLRYQR